MVLLLLIVWSVSILISITVISVLVLQLVKAITDYCRWLKIGKKLYKKDYLKEYNYQSACKGECQDKSSFTKMSVFERWNKLAEAGYRHECNKDENYAINNDPKQIYINPFHILRNYIVCKG